jgi:hypothetical protein
MQTFIVDHDTRAHVDVLYRELEDRLWRSLLLYTRRPGSASDATAEGFAHPPIAGVSRFLFPGCPAPND